MFALPNYLEPHAGQLMGIETEAAIYKERAAKRSSCWAVILGLIPVKDGDKWCVIYGEDLHSGIAGFGDTPEKAIEAFEKEMTTK